MDEVKCPGCNGAIARDAELIGKTVACPFCAHHFEMPSATVGMAETMPSGVNPAAPVAAPVGHPHPAPQPVPASHAHFECPFCHTHTIPYVRSEISSAGWAVFIVLLLVCLPLFWIGLLIKENYRVCSYCGMRLG